MRLLLVQPAYQLAASLIGPRWLIEGLWADQAIRRNQLRSLLAINNACLACALEALEQRRRTYRTRYGWACLTGTASMLVALTKETIP
jgi:hypothetical protein